MAATISLVVPVLNERALIGEALAHFAGLGADQLIVVDGGSSDGTDRAVRMVPGVTLVQTAPGRARQMNAGAQAATGQILLFAHADMTFPREAMARIRAVMAHGVIGGGFFKRYAPSSPLLGAYGWFLNYGWLWGLRRLVGTNGLFVRRDRFLALGGFPEMPFLEDLAFGDALRRGGHIGVIRAPVTVSARRYRTAGILRQIMVNARVLFDYEWRGLAPERLRVVYATPHKERATGESRVRPTAS